MDSKKSGKLGAQFSKSRDRLEDHFLRPGRTAWSSAPGQLPKRDMMIIKRQKEKLEEFLSLREPAGLCEALNNCIIQWEQVQRLREAGRQAQTVLGLYYQPGKIRDQLTNLVRFTEQMDTEKSPEILRNRGYGSYAFFLRNDMEKLRKQNQPETAELVTSENICEADVLSFLKEECTGIDAVKGIPEAWEICERFLQLHENQETFPREMLSQVGKLTEITEYLQLFQKPGIEQLNRLCSTMAKQKKAIINSIEEANKVYEVLTRILTEEWFDRLDPDHPGTPLTDMTSTQLKALYQESLAELNNALLRNTEK